MDEEPYKRKQELCREKTHLPRPIQSSFRSADWKIMRATSPLRLPEEFSDVEDQRKEEGRIWKPKTLGVVCGLIPSEYDNPRADIALHAQFESQRQK